MRKITLVEDEENIAEMLRLNLELENFEVVVFKNGGEARRNLSTLLSSDLLLLDVMLPEFSGLQLCEVVRKKSQIPIIILSAKGNTSDRIEGLKLGANDYLPKPFDLEELLLRINNLLPDAKQGNSILEIGLQRINMETYEVVNKQTDEKVELGKREIELLQFFKSKAGQVVSRDEILDRIWGTDNYPTSRTIDNYILAFRKLFEDDPKHPKYFHSIRGVGYKFTPLGSDGE